MVMVGIKPQSNVYMKPSFHFDVDSTSYIFDPIFMKFGENVPITNLQVSLTSKIGPPEVTFGGGAKKRF